MHKTPPVRMIGVEFHILKKCQSLSIGSLPNLILVSDNRVGIAHKTLAIFCLMSLI